MAEGGSGRRRWKRHIVRQLQQRDRAQKARFSDLVQAYTKLLERPSLDHCSVQFQTPSVDPQMGGPACSPNHACPACVPNAVWDSAILLRCLQNRHEAELSKLETANGELAYKIYEWGRLLRAKDAELEDQTDRLAALNRQLCDLEDWHCRLRSQAEEWSCKNGARKAAYDSLQRRFQQQDGEFRQALEKGEELLQPALRRKADWARRENDRIESSDDVPWLGDETSARKQSSSESTKDTQVILLLLLLLLLLALMTFPSWVMKRLQENNPAQRASRTPESSSSSSTQSSSSSSLHTPVPSSTDDGT